MAHNDRKGNFQMSTDTKEIEVAIDHPLEKLFDLEEGTTVMPRTEKLTDLVPAEEYDDKDDEIDEQFQEVYDHALSAFEDQSAEAELVEGKYKARTMEVGAMLLNTALAAAKEKSALKQHKDKNAVAKGKLGVKTTNNTLIVADRNTLLRAMEGKKVD